MDPKNDHPFWAGFVVGLVTISIIITITLFFYPELIIYYNYLTKVL